MSNDLISLKDKLENQTRNWKMVMSSVIKKQDNIKAKNDKNQVYHKKASRKTGLRFNPLEKTIHAKNFG